MISKLYSDNEKTTANKLAKQIVVDAIESALYWEEKSGVDVGSMTDKEIEEVHRLVVKQMERIQKLLSK
jgi:hypothetical protein